MGFGGIWWKVVYWIHLVEARDQGCALVNTVMNLRVPQKGGENFLTSRVAIRFSRTLLHGVCLVTSIIWPRVGLRVKN